MSGALMVWHGEQKVGELYLGADGRSIGLRHEPTWQQTGVAISQSLPLSQTDFPPENGVAHVWFGNLLPEEGSRAALVRRLGVADDDFALLRALGGDCAGALRILAPSADKQEQSGQVQAQQEQLRAWASGRERYALMTAEHKQATRLSLAGAQDKIPIVLTVDDEIYLPQGGTASSHILKFADKAGIIFNELCMNTLAACVDIPCPETRVLRVDGYAMLAVQRYDRRILGVNRVRIHQEDFCQAMAMPRAQKYQIDRGPDLAKCAALLRRSTVAPAKAIQQLMRWQIFNVLAGNSDGHAKNLSLLQRDDGRWQLAPSYDLVCTRVLPYDANLAFAVGDQFNPQQIIKRDWEAMAKAIAVAPPFLLKQVRQMAEALQQVVASESYYELLLQRGLQHAEWQQMQHLRRYINQQCRKTLKLLS